MSIVTLVFMMLLMGLTLRNNGWFEEHHGLSPAERIRQDFAGNYKLNSAGVKTAISPLVGISKSLGAGEAKRLTISLDTIPIYQIWVSDFEDDQVLLELFELDSSGRGKRLDGCELLLREVEPERFAAQTIGEFCGLKEGSSEYLAMDMELQGSILTLQIEFRGLEDQVLLDTKKYLLERIDSE